MGHLLQETNPKRKERSKLSHVSYIFIFIFLTFKKFSFKGMPFPLLYKNNVFIAENLENIENKNCLHFYHLKINVVVSSLLCILCLKNEYLPWPVWLSGLSTSLQSERFAALIPSQGTCLGCRPGPQLGACKRQLINVSFAFRCFSLLSPLKNMQIKS